MLLAQKEDSQETILKIFIEAAETMLRDEAFQMSSGDKIIFWNASTDTYIREESSLNSEPMNISVYWKTGKWADN